jgi:DNA-directed RNA polymerase subunit alpha
METFPLPTTMTVTPLEENRASILIEPLAPGYGTTVGNALRRALLSALVGAAVTDVRIEGVDHEFSTIPHVKEDVVDIILNIKQLRFRLHTDEPVTLQLSARGKKQVRAKDITANAQAEAVNSNALIATLTADDAALEMELTVRRGRGYLPTESREKEERPIGVLAIDALFSPVRNVGFKIELVRVGSLTNYERLILTMETDGSLTAEEAIKAASRVLLDHFAFVESLGRAEEVTGEVPTDNEVVEEGKESGTVRMTND